MNTGTGTKAAPAVKTSKEPARATKTSEEIVEAEPTFEQIQQRAYEIYLSRGDQPGDDFQDWVQAERELRAGRP
jgi:Protein of unknown function (DUF2934)